MLVLLAVSSARAYPNLTPAVVLVSTSDAALQPLACGTGFVVDRAGLVVTAAHLARGAAFVTVLVDDAREVSAEVVGVDEGRDLAVLRLARTVPHALAVGSTRRVAAGARVRLTAYPFGTARQLEDVTLRAATTETIITAVEETTGFGGGPPTQFLRLAATLQSRSMGAPLTHARANEVIGVVTQELHPWAPHQIWSKTVVPARYVLELLAAVARGKAQVPPAFVTTKLTYPRVDDTPAWMHVRSLPIVPPKAETVAALPEGELPAGELPLAVGSGRMLADPTRPRLYVTEEGREALSVIDTQTGGLEKRMRIGAQPIGLALSPDGTTLFVALSGESQLALVDLKTLTIREKLLLGFRPYDLACVAADKLYCSEARDKPRPRLQFVNPVARTWRQGTDLYREGLLAARPRNEGLLAAEKYLSPGKLYSCDSARGSVSLQTVIGYDGSISDNVDLKVSPDGRRVYLCGSAPNHRVFVADTRTFKQVQELDGANPWARHAAPSPDGKRVYVTTGAPKVLVYDAATARLEGYLQTRLGVQNVVVTGDSGKLAVQFDGSVGLLDLSKSVLRPPEAPLEIHPTVYPLPSLDPEAPVELPLLESSLPGGGFALRCGTGKMLRDPLRPRLYVCEEGADALAVVDTDSGRLERRVVIGSKPVGLALSPDAGTLYVGLTGSRRVAVLDATTLLVKKVIQLEAEPFDLVCPAPDRLYATTRDPHRWHEYYVINPLAGTTLRGGRLYGNCPLALKPGTPVVLVGQAGLSPASIYRCDSSQDPLGLVHWAQRGTIGSYLRDLRFSPDGRWLYVCCGGPVLVLDGETAALVGQFKSARAGYYHVAPSPDGTRVYAAHLEKRVDVFAAGAATPGGGFPVTGTITNMVATGDGGLALQFANGLWLVNPATTALEPPR